MYLTTRLWRRVTASVVVTLTAAGLCGITARAASAEGKVIAAGAANAVAGQYVVALKQGTATSAGVHALANELAARYDGSVGLRYSAALKGFSARISAANARRLAADPAVAFVEQDRVIHTADTEWHPPSWGLDRIDQRL